MAIPTGLLGSEQALQQALAGGTAAAGAGLNAARTTAAPFTGTGIDANAIQAALSGASGRGAQGRAFEDFRSSPGQQFLVDESERALTRNAAAIGGVGGGNVRRALQENAIGLASQDFNNQFSRLSQVADRGAQFVGQEVRNEFDTGGLLAGLQAKLGGQIGAARGQAGRDISDVIGSTSGNLAQILLASGGNVAGGNAQLAELLANLSTGSATALAGVDIPAVNQGQLGNISAIIQAIGTLQK